MSYDWYFIFNSQDFNDLDLVSKTYTVFLSGRGQRDILVTKGNGLGILFEGVFMLLNFNDENPYSREGYAVYKDEDGNVFVGVEVES
jgi:hypothetical protein